MVLNSERQRELLLAIVESGTYNGQVLDEIYRLKEDIKTAKVEESEK